MCVLSAVSPHFESFGIIILDIFDLNKEKNFIFFENFLSLLGIKSADRNELAQISSQPSSDFTSFVGEFKLLNTLLPLVNSRVCSKAGGVYASDGTLIRLNLRV